jgi:hypothetical protein
MVKHKFDFSQKKTSLSDIFQHPDMPAHVNVPRARQWLCVDSF